MSDNERDKLARLRTLLALEKIFINYLFRISWGKKKEKYKIKSKRIFNIKNKSIAKVKVKLKSGKDA